MFPFLPNFLFSIFFFLPNSLVLGISPRCYRMLGKHSTTVPHPQTTLSFKTDR